MNVKIFAEEKVDRLEAEINDWLGTMMNVDVKHTDFTAIKADGEYLFVATVWYYGETFPT